MRLRIGGRWRVAWVALLLSLFACKCGEKEQTPQTAESKEKSYASTVSKLPGADYKSLAGLIPSESFLVLLASDLRPALDWLEKRPWYQDVRKSAPVQDVLASNVFLRLSSLRHKLESASSIALGKLELGELLGTPVGLALRKDKHVLDVLLVKQVDLKVQALDRLAEVLNQITPRKGILESRKVFGLDLRDMSLSGGKHFYYLLFSNLIVASNSEEYLLEAVSLAREKSGSAILADGRVAKLLAEKGKPGELLALLNSKEIIGEHEWLKSFLPGSLLAFRFRSGEEASLQIEAPIVMDGPGAGSNAKLAVGKLVPLDSRILLGLADARLRSIWKEAFKRMKKPRVFEKNSGLDINRDLFAHLSKSVAVVLEGIDMSAEKPLPMLAAIFETDKPAQVEEAMNKLFGYSFGKPPDKKPLKGKPEHVIYAAPAGHGIAPAFAIIEKRLIIGSNAEAVRKIAATAVGQMPSLADLPGFSDKVAGSGDACLVLSYADCKLLSGDLVDYSHALAKHSKRFGADDVEETVVPFFKALAGIGRLGGRIVVADGGARGKLVPLR